MVTLRSGCLHLKLLQLRGNDLLIEAGDAEAEALDGRFAAR